MLKLCNAVYWLALTTWVAVLVSVGVAAYTAFSTLPDRELGVRLERFEAYDANQHGRIAAGLVTEPIFTFADVVAAAAGIIVLTTLVLQLTVFKMRWRSPANAVRALAVACAFGLFLWRVTFIMPEMNRDLRAYWDAAQAGEPETAQRHLAAFNANHRRARPMMDWSLVLLLVAVAASGAALSGPPSRTRPRSSTEMQTPKLVRKT